MRKLFADLWQSLPDDRFGTLSSHAYIIETTAGRDLIYIPEKQEVLADILELGPINRIYLSHNHDIPLDSQGVDLTNVGELVGHHRLDRFLPNGRKLDKHIKSDDTIMLPGGIEAICTPGHTDNNVSFRYSSPNGMTYLFVGDTLYPHNGSWHSYVATRDGGTKEALLMSLRRLKTIDADVVIPCVSVGTYKIRKQSQAEWHAALESAICSLQ